MSSSEDEVVRRPGRGADGGRSRLDEPQDDDGGNNSNLSGSEAEKLNVDDDKDLFGSDSDGAAE